MKLLLPLFLLVPLSLPLAAARADGPQTITGQVVDAGGKPVPDVEVIACQYQRDYGGNGPQELLSSVTTDAEGHWTFKDIEIGQWRTLVSTWKPGMVVASAYFQQPKENATLPPRTLTLLPVKPVRIKLVDWQNRPIPNATLSFASRNQKVNTDKELTGYYGGVACKGFDPIVRTGEDGWVTLPFGADGDRLAVFTSEEKYQYTHIILSVPAEDGLTVRLAPGANLRGRLVDAEGKPLAGKRISNYRALGFPLSEADGTFNLFGFDDAPLFLDVTEPGIIPTPKLLRPKRGETVDAGDIVVTPGATVSGVITDKATGKALPSWIQFTETKKYEGDGYPWGFNTSTNKTGKFEVRLPPGEYKATASPSGSEYYEVKQFEQTVQLVEGQALTFNVSIDLTARFDEGGRTLVRAKTPTGKPEPPPAPDYIYGSVIDKNGNSVTGATVTIIQGDNVVREAITGANGRFAIGPLRGEISPGGNVAGLATGTADNPAPKIYVRATAPGLAGASAVVTPGTDVALKLVLNPPVELRVHLVNSAGGPIVGAKITTKRTYSYLFTADGARRQGQVGKKQDDLPAPATTNAAGDAILSGVPNDGFCELRLEHPDYASFNQVIALPRKAPVSIQLFHPGTVEGRVLMGDEVLKGPGLEMRVQTQWFYTLNETAKAGDDGRFAVKNLPPQSQTGDDFVNLSFGGAGNKNEIGPGLKTELRGSGISGSTVVIDSRGDTERRWIGYPTILPSFTEGQKLQQDLTLVPLALLKIKLPKPPADRKITDLTITYRDPNINSAYYAEPVATNFDANGNMELWVPTGKNLTLEIKPKGRPWDQALWTEKVTDLAAGEVREIETKKPADPDAGYRGTGESMNIRFVGPDGATIPRVKYTAKLSNGNNYGGGGQESSMDGLGYIYTDRDPKGETVEITSPLLDTPTILKWNKDVPPRIVLNRVPETIAPSTQRVNFNARTRDEGEPAPTPASVGDLAPELKVKNWLRGGPVKLADLRGKTVVFLASPYGVQSLLPVLDRHPGKIFVMLVLNAQGQNFEQIFQQNLDQSLIRATAETRKRVEKAMDAVGQDLKVAGDWRGYNAALLGAQYSSAIIGPDGRIAATGLWGADFAAKVDQLAEE